MWLNTSEILWQIISFEVKDWNDDKHAVRHRKQQYADNIKTYRMSNQNFGQMRFEGGNTYLDQFSDRNGLLAEFRDE